jgi:hypothetical protein
VPPRQATGHERSWARAIGFGFSFSLGFAFIEPRGRTLAYLFKTPSAPSPQYGCVDQGAGEYSNHEYIDHEPKPPAGTGSLRSCVSRNVNATEVFRSTLCRAGADSVNHCRS